MKYKEYVVEKGKLDLLSSLKALNKKILSEKLEEFGVSDIYELKDFILNLFEHSLNVAKDDEFTNIYFKWLLDNENTKYTFVNEQDIEALIVFIYNNGREYDYYIPTEIKQIINNTLNAMTLEAQFNLEYACNTPIIKDLKGLLETLSVNDLKNIGRLLHVNRLSNKPKKEVVKIVYSALTDEDKLTNLIENLVDKEFNLLEALMKNKGTIQDNNISVDIYHILYLTGLVFIFKRADKFYISMTDDIYNVMKKINLKRMRPIIEKNTKVYNLARAMVELYGVVSSSYLDDYYNSYYDEEDSISSSLLFCGRIDNIDIIRDGYNLYFVHKIFRNRELDQLFNDIISRQEKIKRKNIELEELLKYSDYNYYEETKAKSKFKKYLIKKEIPVDVIEVIIKIISDMYRLGNSYIGASIDMLQECGVKITDKNIDGVIIYLTEIYNNSRIWVNNGWTPIEMRKEYCSNHSPIDFN